jgi:hypothetical protein
MYHAAQMWRRCHPELPSSAFKSFWDLLSVATLPFICENLPPRKQMVPKSKATVNVLNWNDQVKIWDLLKSGLTLSEVGRGHGKKESSICSTELYAYWVFLHGRFLGAVGQGSTVFSPIGCLFTLLSVSLLHIMFFFFFFFLPTDFFCSAGDQA